MRSAIINPIFLSIVLTTAGAVAQSTAPAPGHAPERAVASQDGGQQLRAAANQMLTKKADAKSMATPEPKKADDKAAMMNASKPQQTDRVEAGMRQTGSTARNAPLSQEVGKPVARKDNGAMPTQPTHPVLLPPPVPAAKAAGTTPEAVGPHTKVLRMKAPSPRSEQQRVADEMKAGSKPQAAAPIKILSPEEQAVRDLRAAQAASATPGPAAPASTTTPAASPSPTPASGTPSPAAVYQRAAQPEKPKVDAMKQPPGTTTSNLAKLQAAPAKSENLTAPETPEK